MDRNKIYLVALVVAVLAISLFPIRLDFHYWDEAVYLQHAEILSGESPNNYNEFDFRPPVFWTSLGLIYMLVPSEITAHVFVAVLSTFAVILLYILGKELYDEKLGLLAALIYGLSPRAIELSHDILVDTVLPIPWLLTAIFLTRAVKTGQRKYYALTGFGTALAILTKFTSLTLVPAVFTVLGLSLWSKYDFDLNRISDTVKDFLYNRDIWLTGTCILTGLIPYLFWSYAVYGGFLHTFKQALIYSGAPSSFWTYVLAPHRFLLIPFLAGVILYVEELSNIREFRVYMPVILFLSMFVPLQFILPNRQLRFLLPVVPFLALMSAQGFMHLRNSLEGKFDVFMLVLVISSLVMLPGQLDERSIFEDGMYVDRWHPPVEDVSYWLKENTDEDATVYTNHYYPPLGYYSKRNIVVIEPDGSNFPSEKSGYFYYAEDSPHEWPGDSIFEDERFTLNKSIRSNHVFYYSGK